MENIIQNGVWPTMITPFTGDDTIDYPAVERLLNWYAENGAAGVFAICQSSEMFFMTLEEKRELLRFICSHRPKGLQVIASGHTKDSLKEQIEEAKYLSDNDISAYVLLTNRFEKENG